MALRATLQTSAVAQHGYRAVQYAPASSLPAPTRQYVPLSAVSSWPAQMVTSPQHCKRATMVYSSASDSQPTADSHAGHAFLHDFCMTIPYSALMLVAGAVLLFLTRGAVAGSAAAATQQQLVTPLFGVGIATAVASVLSLKQWKKAQSSAMYTLLAAGASGGAAYLSVPLATASSVLGVVCGAVAILSGAMALFLLYNVLAGGNPPRKGSH